MNDNVPKYQRVYAALRHDILIGKYETAEKFPSEGTLMRRFGVSRITIRQAMSDLKKEGFLEVRNGAGTYLSALARHATGMIGLVIPDYSSNDFFRRLGDELVRAGNAVGYTMLLGALPGDTTAERAHEAVALACEYARRKVVGVIIEPIELMPNSADLTQEIIQAFDAHKIPIVLIDRDISPFRRSRFDLVGIDNVSAGFVLGERLIADGARRIGFLLPPHSASTNLQRMLGVAGACIQAGIGWSDRNMICANTSDTKALRKALVSNASFDAVVCHNDQTSEKLPRSVKSASFDGFEPAAHRRRISMRQPIALLAKTAIAALLERVRNPQLPPRQILLEAEPVTFPPSRCNRPSMSATVSSSRSSE